MYALLNNYNNNKNMCMEIFKIIISYGLKKITILNNIIFKRCITSIKSATNFKNLLKFKSYLKTVMAYVSFKNLK